MRDLHIVRMNGKLRLLQKYLLGHLSLVLKLFFIITSIFEQLTLAKPMMLFIGINFPSKCDLNNLKWVCALSLSSIIASSRALVI